MYMYYKYLRHRANVCLYVFKHVCMHFVYTCLCERVQNEARSRLPRFFLFCIRNDDNDALISLMFAIENRYESLVPRTTCSLFLS